MTTSQLKNTENGLLKIEKKIVIKLDALSIRDKQKTTPVTDKVSDDTHPTDITITGGMTSTI
ncbi:hypothetical protein [Arachidicoccus ginsenosidimutans]|uniref:hypothetical protein n=1 Tax=Arachidicoccus sp. BS20 TaxID=1850526 RepID=UPI0012E7CC96|nr:hypothetical protein [Arachidicoccus sp. BS20]